MWKLFAGSCPVGEQRSCPRAQPPASAAPVFHRREIRFREVSDLVHTLCTWNPLIPVTFLIAVTRDLSRGSKGCLCRPFEGLQPFTMEKAQ